MSAGAALLDHIARGKGSSKATMVDLRGRLSNPHYRDIVADTAKVVSGLGNDDGSTASPVRARHWRIVDRLGEEVARELRRDSRAGTPQRKLAERYGISVSSVKRILRH
jgi:hypothetical protein